MKTPTEHPRAKAAKGLTHPTTPKKTPSVLAKASSPIWPLLKGALKEGLVRLCRQRLTLCGEPDPAASSEGARFWGKRNEIEPLGEKSQQLLRGKPKREELTSELLRAEVMRTRTWESRVKEASSERALRVVRFPERRTPLWVSDAEGEGILLPLDPALILERHRESVDRLRVAVGNRAIFEAYLDPFLLRLAAAFQGLPRAPMGLWREEGGLMEVALKSAIASISVLDARVVGAELPAMKRDAWMMRLRVAAAIASAISEASALSRIELLSREEGGAVAERLSPGHESAYAFGLRQSGRRFTLTWTPEEGQKRTLTTLPLDLLYQLLSEELRRWLREVPLGKAGKTETVLSVLENVVQFQLGETEMERALAQTVVLAHKIAYDQEAKARAAREGQLPLMSGFARAAELVMRTRIKDAVWRVNSQGSPLIWAQDGYFLRWPEALFSVMKDRELQCAFSHASEEPDVVAQILATEGVLLRDKRGEVIFRVDERHPTLAGVNVVQLAEDRKLHELVLKSRLTHQLPASEMALRSTNPEKREGAKGNLPYRMIEAGEAQGSGPRFLWKPRVGVAFPPLLVGFLELLNDTEDPSLWWTPAGLFIPESLFSRVDEHYFAGLKGYLVLRRVTLPSGYVYHKNLDKMVRKTPFWNVLVPEHCQKKFARYLPVVKALPDEEEVEGFLAMPTITGIILREECVSFVCRQHNLDRDVKLPAALLTEANDFGAPCPLVPDREHRKG